MLTGHHYNKCITIYDLTEKFIICVINYWMTLWSSWCQSFKQWIMIYTFSSTTRQKLISAFSKILCSAFIFQSESFPLWDPRADTTWVPVQSVKVSLSKCCYPKNFLLCEIHWSSINVMNAKPKERRWSAEEKRVRGSWKMLHETEEGEREPGRDLCNVWA